MFGAFRFFNVCIFLIVRRRFGFFGLCLFKEGGELWVGYSLGARSEERI